MGPFTVLKAIGDAYTLDILPSLRLHPTIYVRSLKEYSPASLHGMAPSSDSKAHSLRAPKNLAFLVPHPFKHLAVRLPSLARCSLTPRSSIKGSFSFQLGIDSLVQSRVFIFLGKPGRQQYLREGAPLLVEAKGQKR
uniref:Uncharacterized protein n=1 Tax=Peronospora matthiolae TaxID=2874970 RepID=A0AAV1UJ06_9STRA